MAVHTAEAHDIESRIADAAAATESLARQYFGDAAYLSRRTQVDHETGDVDPVFEVHYCFDDPDKDFDRLASLHEAFMDAFVRITSPDILARVILKPIPTDAD
jgi:hypothetical protein